MAIAHIAQTITEDPNAFRETITGEYWIIDGDVTYCDGDAGVDVPNHEAVVIAHIFSLITDALEAVGEHSIADIFHRHITDEAVIDLIAFREDLNNSLDWWVREGIVTDEAAQDIDSYIAARVAGAGIDRDMYNAAMKSGNMSSDRDHARDYGITGLKWIKVAGNNITLWDLDHTTVKNLERGLDRICEVEGVDFDRSVWDIEVKARNSKFLVGVPGIAIVSPSSILAAAQPSWHY